jgi:hypothetical protein
MSASFCIFGLGQRRKDRKILLGEGNLKKLPDGE